MKKVISWKTTSSRGVRLGSALSALVEADMGGWASRAARWGSCSARSDRLGLLGGGDQRVDRAGGDLGRLHRQDRDPVAEVGEEEDRGDRERDALEGDEEGRRDPLGHLLGLG